MSRENYRDMGRNAVRKIFGTRFILLSLALLLPISATAGETDDGTATLDFLELRDGDVVPETFEVQFVITGMDIVPAGDNQPNSGHHHLLIDLDELPPMNLPLPKTDQVVHFGGGQTSTELTLAPGEHTLQLLLGDYMHVPHDPPVISPRITITVKEQAAADE